VFYLAYQIFYESLFFIVKKINSVIIEHYNRLDSMHKFDWKRVKILDEESILQKQLISEIIYIKQQKNGLNLKNDTDLLDCAYLDILLTT